MSDLKVNTIESAPEASRPILDKAQKTLGFVPNLYGVLAESPASLEAYVTLGSILDRSASFTATERQIILLTASFENGCDYCMAAHSAIAGMQRVPEDVVQALRSGDTIPDGRLETLREFTRKVVQQRGWVSENEVQAFRDAGFTQAQVLEVILGIAMKVLSNYTSHIAETPLDEAFQPHAWTLPHKTCAR